jgi:hypothetical protein
MKTSKYLLLIKICLVWSSFYSNELNLICSVTENVKYSFGSRASNEFKFYYLKDTSQILCENKCIEIGRYNSGKAYYKKKSRKFNIEKNSFELVYFQLINYINNSKKNDSIDIVENMRLLKLINHKSKKYEYTSDENLFDIIKSDQIFEMDVLKYIEFKSSHLEYELLTYNVLNPFLVPFEYNKEKCYSLEFFNFYTLMIPEKYRWW